MRPQQPLVDYRSLRATPQVLLLDTCVLIDHLRGYDPARQWLTGVLADGGASAACSVITLAELLSGVSAESAGESDAVKALVGLTRLLPVDGAVAAKAAEYMRSWRRSHGIALPDALIAATASMSEAKLVTRDKGHFPMDDIEVISPY
jgi:predicted nucleic acid-binding protein